MIAVFRHFIFSLLQFFLIGQTLGQDTGTTDFYDQIKNYDLSTVINPNSFLAEDREDSKDTIQRAEILGFIGDNYQRFYIHFISVTQNPTNHYEYLVSGKTMVKETICSFQGKLTITKASLHKNGDFQNYKKGFTICDVLLFEDKKQSSSGSIKGTLKSNFIIDEKGNIRYDALMFIADGFSNNQFVGIWTSYKTNNSKKCHWGDYRIPDCGDLDIGAAEFGVADKYIKNGWENYSLARVGDPDKPEVIKARQKENSKWWD